MNRLLFRLQDMCPTRLTQLQEPCAQPQAEPTASSRISPAGIEPISSTPLHQFLHCSSPETNNRRMPRRRRYQPLSSPSNRPEVLNSDDDDESIADGSIRNPIEDSTRSISNLELRSGDGAMNNHVSSDREASSTVHHPESDDEEDDEELLNPYIMNLSFHEAALLPPSVELPPLRGQQLEFAAGNSISSINSREEIGRNHNNNCIHRELFDPYWDGRSSSCIDDSSGRDHDSLSSWRKDGLLLEMEEETIDFFSESANGLHADSLDNDLYGNNNNGNRNSSWDYFPKDAATFNHSNVEKEYSEHSPLAGCANTCSGRGDANSNSIFFGSTSYNNRSKGSIIQGLELLWNKILSSTTNNHGLQSPTTTTTNNPFAHRITRVTAPTIRGKKPSSAFRRMKFSHLLQIILASCVLMTVFTIGTNVRRILHQDVGSSISSNEYSNSVVLDQNGVEYYPHGKPNSLVLKKMEKAKRRWWKKQNKNDLLEEEGSSNVEKVEGGLKGEQVSDLQQQKQEQQSQSDTAQHNILDSAIQIISNATQSDKNAQEVAIVVQTGEDGSILIKLPPPKMGLEQSTRVQEQQLQQQKSSAQEVNLDSDPFKGTTETTPTIKDDDTVYIKLPYQESQHRALSDTKQEVVDPPLLGGLTTHSHPNLHRRPLPSLELYGSATSHYDKNKHSLHSQHSHNNGHHGIISIHSAHQEHHPGVLDALRDEFGSWMEKHGKKYGSGEEKERRFRVWKKNHFRISEKNERHGPCRMTGKAIFGHNLFSDLEPEEFQDRFLTGYRGPREGDDDNHKQGESSGPRGGVRRYKSDEMEDYPPSVSVHPTVQRKLVDEQQQQQQDSSPHGANFDDYKSKYYQYKKKFGNDCDWWDVSCMLRWIFGYQYVGGTREPIYDESTYPDSLDWRNMGVVSSVHAQGSCGACWAITAVETIESAYAIKTGELLDLAEEEVIACDGTCEMCNGGWPQNAYKYVMKHDGLPVKNADYDGDFLYYLTATLTGESETVSENDMASYFAQTCPAGVREGGGGGEGGSGSRSRDNDYGSNNYDSARYGSIKGYGYATDRCVCYTNGSGCDCDDQDEQKAVLNIASYGPAAVCLEASLWQSYEGGIMTSDTGCGSAFLDMNHCVQVVGYAFTTNNDKEGGSADQKGGSRDGGSRDAEGKREGYWIVKNQWSKYWGMNGYAYLAMGDNTCGILNDMTQVYM